LRHWLGQLACLVALSAWAGAANADVTLTNSNAPVAILDAQLTQLFGNERAALGAVDPTHLLTLQTKPTRRRLWGRVPEFSYTRDFLAQQPVASGNEQWRCLSEALYFEARGEDVKGQYAVAEVILNRTDSASFPDTVCKVVNQGTGRRFQCQFTYTCDGRSEVITDKRAWKQVGRIARIMLDGKERELTGGATYYHAKSVRPRWARKFERTVAIGAHYFYKLPVRTASNG
jgi:Cell Wall Hydrolase